MAETIGDETLEMDMPKKQLVAEALIDLHRRLSTLPTRSHERRMIMQETANLYGVSEQTLYRAIAQRARPRALRRSDRGTPRVLPQDKMEYYCELIAALKVRTSNKKGRHLSTGEAIRIWSTMMLLALPLHVTWSRNDQRLSVLVSGQTTAMLVWCIATGLTTTHGRRFCCSCPRPGGSRSTQ